MQQPDDPKDCILLVADGSNLSDAAARFAFDFAARANMKILALYPIDTATMDYLLQMHIFVEDEREEFEHDLEAKGYSYLARVAELGKKYDVPTECVMCRGRFHQEIIQAQKKYNARMIVIGAWRTNSKRHDNFSVERDLLFDLTTCPITVVK